MNLLKTLVVREGALTIPADLCDSRGWHEGTVVLVLVTDEGVLLKSRDDLEATVQAELAGSNLVEELLAERREAARLDNEEALGS